MTTLAWTVAIFALLLGTVGAMIPGFPGTAVALIGLVAFASLTEFAVVPMEALWLAAAITALTAGGQLVSPLLGSRALAGSAGAATGAALGAVVGLVIPLPFAAWGTAMIGALLLGALARDEGWREWLRGTVGTAGGCLVAAGFDLVGVLALGSLLAFADFWSRAA